MENKLFDPSTGEYIYSTPKTKGYTDVLELSNDTARFFINNVPDSVYKFTIQKERDITNWPDDSLPVIAFYSFTTGLKKSYFRIRICNSYMVTEQSYRSDIGGDNIWERK